MCEYCKEYSSRYLLIEPYNDGNIFMDLTGNALRIFDDESPGLLTTLQINYCPMCGRRLE